MEFLFLIAFAVGIGMFAQSKGRNPWGWGIASLVISPLLAGIILAMLKDQKQEQSINKIEMEQQQLKERIAVNEVQMNQRFQQVENRLDSNAAATRALEARRREDLLLGEGKMQCPHCGEVVKNGAVKCCHCGLDIVPIKMKECPYCRELIRETATVCKFCHSKLTEDDAAPMQAPAAPMQAPAAPMQAPAAPMQAPAAPMQAPAAPVQASAAPVQAPMQASAAEPKTEDVPIISAEFYKQHGNGRVAAEENHICHVCHTAVKSGSRFCPNCGSRIKDVE